MICCNVLICCCNNVTVNWLKPLTQNPMLVTPSDHAPPLYNPPPYTNPHPMHPTWIGIHPFPTCCPHMHLRSLELPSFPCRIMHHKGCLRHVILMVDKLAPHTTPLFLVWRTPCCFQHILRIMHPGWATGFVQQHVHCPLEHIYPFSHPKWCHSGGGIGIYIRRGGATP